MSRLSQGLHPRRTGKDKKSHGPDQAMAGCVQGPRPLEIRAASGGHGPRGSPGTRASADGMGGCFSSPSWNCPPPHQPRSHISRSKRVACQLQATAAHAGSRLQGASLLTLSRDSEPYWFLLAAMCSVWRCIVQGIPGRGAQGLEGPPPPSLPEADRGLPHL